MTDAFDAALAAAIEDGIEPPPSRFARILHDALCAVARSHPSVDRDLIEAALNAWARCADDGRTIE